MDFFPVELFFELSLLSATGLLPRLEEIVEEVLGEVDPATETKNLEIRATLFKSIK